ncbi:hypothetical protein EJ06DRAFT_281342 [Trichodelitschia bisporula]|uniref:Uncharacterized protein n=1 Tax=Trichodelitschia bisporula TaxID=703511 RepID=A0A6G1I5Q1_9PEZI|nr:hypothetical protein EJ06DRAFT_281342 [Trichodelitschia bisporula]
MRKSCHFGPSRISALHVPPLWLDLLAQDFVVTQTALNFTSTSSASQFAPDCSIGPPYQELPAMQPPGLRITCPAAIVARRHASTRPSVHNPGPLPPPPKKKNHKPGPHTSPCTGVAHPYKPHHEARARPIPFTP